MPRLAGAGGGTMESTGRSTGDGPQRGRGARGDESRGGAQSEAFASTVAADLAVFPVARARFSLVSDGSTDSRMARRTSSLVMASRAAFIAR